ncbi:CCDC158 family protein [Rickettsiella massiliensis]|uniref:subtilisin-like serine protease-like protein n=1 Tax=Rickettsiella massiliensis TaxID=676517 RepID=UPI000299D62D|nr:subtilisin-like serine protease-like protein [Rickettsiella massiliensis]
MPNISVGMILKDIQENLKKLKPSFYRKISQIICLLPDLPQKEVSFFKKNIQDPHKTSTNKFFELFKKKIPSGSQRLHASNTANQQRKAILEWVLENTGWEPGNDQQWSYSSKGKLTKIPPEIRVPSLLKSIQDTTTQPKKDPYILVLHKICLLINEKKTQCEEIANSDEFKQSLLENKEKKAIPRRANLVNNGPIKPDLSVEANLNLAPLLSESESIEKNDQSETTDASSAASFEKRTIDQGNKSLTEESFTKEETPDFIVNKSNSRTKLSDLTKKLKLTITEINDKHKIFVTNIDKASNSLQRAINELNQMNEKTQLYKQFQESIDQSDDLEVLEEIKTDQQTLQDKEDEIDTLNQAHKQQEETIKQLNELNAQLTENKEDSNQKITALKNQLQEAEKNQKNISQQVEELKTELEEKNNDHKQALKDKKDEIDTLNQAHKQQEETIKQLNELNAQLTKNKEDSNQKITALTNQVEELETKLKEENNAHQQALQDKDHEIDTLKTDDQQQKEIIKTLTTAKDTFQQALQDKKDEIDRLKEKLEEQETNITTLENQLKRDQDNLNHKITKLNQEIESKNKIISDFKNLSKNKTKEQSVQTEHSIEPSRGTTKVDLQSQSLTDQPSITDNDEGNYKSKKIGTMDKDTLSENQPPFSDSTDSDGDSDTESYVSCLQNQHSLASDSEESDIGPQDNPDSGYDSSDTEERKGQSQFDYNHLKNFPSLAKIISSEINKDHCDDITELDTFNVSKKTKGVFFPNISDQKREEILTNEKNNLEQKFNERLAKLWKDYAEKPTISRDELQRLFSAFEGDINQIKKECFNNLLEKVKKDLDEEGFVFNEKSCDDLFAEYLKWIKPTQDRIISAGHYQTSPLLNQLKIKISPFHCTAAEEAENEFKKYGLHLKKENPTVLGTSIGFSLY